MPYGTSVADAVAVLTDTMEGALDDTSTVTLDIDWAADATYDAGTPGTYTFVGTLSHRADEEDDYTIPDELETVEVTVTATRLMVSSNPTEEPDYIQDCHRNRPAPCVWYRRLA